MSGTHEGAIKGWQTRRDKQARRRGPMLAKPRYSIRAYTYGSAPGFLLSGHDEYNRKVSIFTRSRGEAERMRNDLKAGREPRFDFERRRRTR